MHIVTSSQLPEFVDSLQTYFPQSLITYHIAKNFLEEKYAWIGTDIIVDKYPEYSVCITRQNGSTKDHISFPTQEYQAVTIFTTSRTALEEFLGEKNLLDWSRKIAFIDVDIEMIETVQKLCEKFGVVAGHEDRYRAKMFVLPFQAWQKMYAKSVNTNNLAFPYFTAVVMIEHSDEHPTVKISSGWIRTYTNQQHSRFLENLVEYLHFLRPTPMPLPEGLREAPLTLDNVDQIAKEWNVEGRGGDYTAAYPLFRELIGRNFPSVGLFNEKDELIAYCMYDMVGSVGKAFTREDYRDRGIFTYMQHRLSEKIFQETSHRVLYGGVYTHNAASLKVSRRSCGEVAEWITKTLFFSPKP